MGNYGHLSRVQTKQIHERVLTFGLEPADFEWGSGVWDTISYQEMPFLMYKHPQFDDGERSFFQFGYSDDNDALRGELLTSDVGTGSGKYSFRYSPGHGDRTTQGYFAHWSDILHNVETWLAGIRELQDTPDVWAQDTTLKSALVATPHGSDDRFTPSEIATIRQQFDALAEAVRSQGLLQGEHYDAFMQWKAESEEAATRLTKKDWKNQAVGAFMALVMTVGTAPHIRDELGRLLGAALIAIQNAPLFLR